MIAFSPYRIPCCSTMLTNTKICYSLWDVGAPYTYFLDLTKILTYCIWNCWRRDLQSIHLLKISKLFKWNFKLFKWNFNLFSYWSASTFIGILLEPWFYHRNSHYLAKIWSNLYIFDIAYHVNWPRIAQKIKLWCNVSLKFPSIIQNYVITDFCLHLHSSDGRFIRIGISEQNASSTPFAHSSLKIKFVSLLFK